MTALLVPTALRAFVDGPVTPRTQREPKEPAKDRGHPLSDEVLAFDLLTMPGLNQEMTVLSFRRSIGPIAVDEGLVLPDKCTGRVRRAVHRYAKHSIARLSPCIVRGDTALSLPVVQLRTFLNKYLYGSGYLGLGQIVLDDAPFVLARLAAFNDTPSNRPGSFLLHMMGEPGKDRAWHDWPGAPPIWVEPRHEAWQLSFQSQRPDLTSRLRDGTVVSAVAFVKGAGQYRGRFVDVRHAAGALFDDRMPLASLARLLSVADELQGRELAGTCPTDDELDGLRDRVGALLDVGARRSAGPSGPSSRPRGSQSSPTPARGPGPTRRSTRTATASRRCSRRTA